MLVRNEFTEHHLDVLQDIEVPSLEVNFLLEHGQEMSEESSNNWDIAQRLYPSHKFIIKQ